ncbi:ATP-grasp domain-containing protein [Cellvibrio sp. NN19]|uniref:carboxylate--amine ligase n=1 Tax=Cellvibrio chitinivorans TaxID=3102792 RepID=UPI002B406071|nr:ATP-grasp domain-containing protein [Cellvibrio sp. NN19]
MQTYKILVLDAAQRSALAVVRSLGQKAVLNVYTAEASTQALAGSSRYSQAFFSCPSSTYAPTEFLAWLEQLQEQESFDLIIPVTEITSQLLLMHQSELRNIQIPFAPYEKVMALADKHQLLIQAEASGVPIPTYHWHQNTSTIQPEKLNYPCVIKPCLSRIFSEGRWLSTTVRVLHSAADWQDALRKDHYLQQFPFMIQEFIPGSGAGIFALYNQGRPVAFFAHKRLREKPPQGGVSVLSESIEINPLLKTYTEQLLDHVGWHGVAMIEFRITPDGKPYLMEINTRFWGSLQLAIDSGIDFPYWLTEISLGLPITAADEYRKGQRLRWLLGDLDSLYLVLKSSNSIWCKMRSILLFIIPSFNTRHEINRWRDIKPAIFELKHYILQLMGR